MGGLDLLTKTVAIEGQQCIVRRVRRTAQRIGREHGSVAEVDGVENGGEYADVGLGPGNNQAVDPPPAQQVAQLRLGKW